jgi:hypothetical protein
MPIKTEAALRWKMLSTKEKIRRCEKIRDGYPGDHPQRKRIQKQINLYKERA